jgi:hypothetical protein
MLVFLVKITKILSESTHEIRIKQLHFDAILLVLAKGVFCADARSDVWYSQVIDAGIMVRDSTQTRDV